MLQTLVEQVALVHKSHAAFSTPYRKLTTYNDQQMILKLTDKNKTQILSLTLASNVR